MTGLTPLLLPEQADERAFSCRIPSAQETTFADAVSSLSLRALQNWDFKRHSRSQRDLHRLQKHNPSIDRMTRIWYHTTLHSGSTWDDVANVVRHEDGMAKKRRVRSKRTGIEEQAAPRRGRPKGSGGPLKIPGVLTDDSSEEEEVGQKKPRTTSRRASTAAAAPAKRGPPKAKAKDDDDEAELDADRPSSAKKRKVGASPKKGVATNDDLPFPTADPAENGAAGRETMAGEANDDGGLAENRDSEAELDAPTTEVAKGREAGAPEDDDQDAEGEIDADGVVDEDTEMGGDAPAEPQEDAEPEPPAIVTRGRRTRASQGLRGLPVEPSVSPAKSTRGRGGQGRGKKANAGLSQPEDAVTVEKQEAIQSHNGETDSMTAAAEAPLDEGEQALGIVRQEAPKPQSRGGGWYIPTRVAEAQKQQTRDADGSEQPEPLDPASEDMRRGGAAIPAGASASTSQFALPRPPHLSNLAEKSTTAGTNASAEAPEADRSSSQPPLQNGESSPKSASGATPSSAIPSTIHHPQDAPNPYFSDPGRERPSYHSEGQEPAPRPYIHPAHSLPSDLFVPGAGPLGAPNVSTDREPIASYPVPISDEQRQERDRAEVQSTTARNGAGTPGHEDFDAEYAKLEAIVAAGDAEGQGDADADTGTKEGEALTEKAAPSTEAGDHPEANREAPNDGPQE